MTMSVVIPLTDLANALGTQPEDIQLALDLAHRIGAVRVRDGLVELPACVVLRLGLSRDADGRWMADGDHRPAKGQTSQNRSLLPSRQPPRGAGRVLSVAD